MASKTRWFLGFAALLAGLAGCAMCGGGHKEALSSEERAGYPYEVSCLAHPSDTGHYTGYLVGGGSACPAEAPKVDEGTWGWDYEGLFCHSRIILDWWHGKYQGGYGAYETDGPRPVECIQTRND
jgi:hypothetical protein